MPWARRVDERVSRLFKCLAPGTPDLLGGGLLYLSGVILVTVTANVPLNNELAAVSPGRHEGARTWARYLSVWTRWNPVRTAAPLVPSVLFVMALL